MHPHTYPNFPPACHLPPPPPLACLQGDMLRLVHVVPCLPSLGPLTGSDLIMDASGGVRGDLGGHEGLHACMHWGCFR